LGTEITLDVGGLSITYSKNHMGIDHGSLFQERDLTPIRWPTPELPAAEVDLYSPLSDSRFDRTLKDTVPRLELLGFDLDRVGREYRIVAETWWNQFDEEEPRPAVMSFSDFRQLATRYPIEALDDAYIEDADPQEEERRIRHRFADVALDEIPNLPENPSAYSERAYFGSLIDILHPYSTIRLLAENKENLNARVVWQYGPLVEAGWAQEREFYPGARRAETFLIATEGTSDIHILKHALKLSRPEVMDFFRFIDISESHPFSGVGNLVKFAEGLAKIDVQNQVLFLFDNDAEGLEAHEKLSRLSLPRNMRGALLPQLASFRKFPARGPDGLVNADINMRAAAIECYLDLNLESRPPAEVRWTNYKKELGVYHGALEHKKSYMEAFLKQTAETIAAGKYDIRKIRAVVDYLVATCAQIALDQWDENSVAPRY
jgi:hypothetical protein